MRRRATVAIAVLLSLGIACTRQVDKQVIYRPNGKTEVWREGDGDNARWVARDEHGCKAELRVDAYPLDREYQASIKMLVVEEVGRTCKVKAPPETSEPEDVTTKVTGDFPVGSWLGRALEDATVYQAASFTAHTYCTVRKGEYMVVSHYAEDEFWLQVLMTNGKPGFIPAKAVQQ